MRQGGGQAGLALYSKREGQLLLYSTKPVLVKICQSSLALERRPLGNIIYYNYQISIIRHQDRHPRMGKALKMIDLNGVSSPS